MGYLERIDSYKDEMIRVLADSVACPSVDAPEVRTADGEVYPFGKGVQDALVHMLKVGEELGFETCNVDNYAGYIDYRIPGEEGEKAPLCAIVGHLDVMPEATGWHTDPFKLEEKDGFLYGRGTSDDKGPVVAGLYAMKALKEEGIPLKANIRLVLGLNEETGESSINYYTEHCGHPDMGFTPDGEFPIVNGEMGILTFELAQKLSPVLNKDDLRLTKLESGVAPNAVPESAKAVIAGDKKYFDHIIETAKAYAAETGYNVKAYRQGSSLVIETKGVAAHGAHPDLGLNAASIMMGLLGKIGFASEELNDYIAFYNEHIAFNLHGEEMGCKLEDKYSGPLIFNVGLVNINEELASVTVNIRYPVLCKSEEVLSGIQSTLEGTKIGLVMRASQNPIFMDLNTPMVEKMLAAYREETGDYESAPIIEPGGTYAKMVNNILCFGAMFPDDENTMHQADEKFSIESFMKMTRVYARALYSLCCE